jgi:hypothetical protein
VNTAQRHAATSALQRLAEGGRARVQDPTVRSTVAALAELGLLRMPTRSREPKLVPADATILRLRALAFEGWTPTALGYELDVPKETLKTITRGGSRRCSARLAARVNAFYAAPTESPLTPTVRSRVWSNAAKRGWFTRNQLEESALLSGAE